MKRQIAVLLFAGTVTLSGLTSSCGKDEPVNTRSVSESTINLITPLAISSTDELSVAKKGNYLLEFKEMESEVTISCSDLTFNGGSYNFRTPSLKMMRYAFEDGTGFYTTEIAELNTTKEITNLTFNYTNALYNEVSVAVPGYKIPVVGSELVLSYRLDNKYQVSTFPSDAFYGGSTMTSFTTQGGTQGTYGNDNIRYRVVMDLDEKKADIIMYNAKFAEQAPAIAALVLKNLDVKMTHTGYEIVGNDIVPETVEGDITVPNEHYSFNEIRLISDIIAEAPGSVKIDFTVAQRFHGSFSGCFYRM